MALSAKSIYISVLTVFSAAGAAILSALGGWDTSLQFLIGIMAVDYLLGVLIALVWHKSQKTADGTFESNASLKGLLRKFSVLLIVYVAVQLDTVANTGG
ncbi:phage holin family protein, partial [Faecalispora jeddahensis]